MPWETVMSQPSGKVRRGRMRRSAPLIVAIGIVAGTLTATICIPQSAFAQFRMGAGVDRGDGGFAKSDGGYRGDQGWGYRRGGYGWGRSRYKCAFGGCGRPTWGSRGGYRWPRTVYYPPRGPIEYPRRGPIHYPPRIYYPPYEPVYPPDGGDTVYHRPPRRIRQAAPVYPSPPIVAPVTRKVSRQAPPAPPAPPAGAGQGSASASHFVIPATGETRYVPDEVLVEIPARLTASALGAIERRLGLTLIASRDLTLTSSRVNRYRIAKGRSVAETVRVLRAEANVSGAQPNYLFALQQDAPAPPAAAPTMPAVVTAEAGYSLQYTIAALHLAEAHRLATGKGVRVAIIDSGIDADGAEIRDRIVARFDAVGGVFQPHSHGTAIAGAILAHAKLVGVAPDADVIAIRAFTGAGKPNGAEGTSFHILEGLEFAAVQNARIVNMSFAGPHDAMLARALEALRAKGVAEIAAAGNGGAQSPPLYPGAEPGVIAVTATDSKGQLFALANRGAYIAMAAPGVDILLPAPADSVQIVSGTSIAAAHVTGIAALMLEKYGTLTPDSLILVLDAGAHKPDPSAAPQDYGAGVIDAFAVLRTKPGQAALPAPALPVSAASR
jgi:subtilisin family serine protease